MGVCAVLECPRRGQCGEEAGLMDRREAHARAAPPTACVPWPLHLG